MKSVPVESINASIQIKSMQMKSIRIKSIRIKSILIKKGIRIKRRGADTAFLRG